MNIFYLHKDPKLAVKPLINKHVVKMVLETGQLLSTCHRVVDGEHYIDSSSGRRLQKWRHPDKTLDEKLYKSQHFNHPCSIWLRESADNYVWLYNYFLAISDEYTQRFKKIHLTELKLKDILAEVPKGLEYKGLTPFAQAMPEMYHNEDPILAYHGYYMGEKLKLGTEEDYKRYFEFMYEYF